MNILYIAYSCLPNKGSEEKIGWNIPVQSAKLNSVFVLTKEEHRSTIEDYLRVHPIDNIQFYYVDIPDVYKLIFKGAAYSVRLNIWHKRAFRVAKTICQQEKIDIIHQITPIEFRSIGDYGKIPHTRFVCGPLGGGESLPVGLRYYAKGHLPVEWMRTVLNKWCRFQFKLSQKLKQCDYIMFANRETKEYLADLVQSIPNEIYFDNGIDELDRKSKRPMRDMEHHTISFLVAGRLSYRKGHSFLLDALSSLPKNIDYRCRIVGDGPEMKSVKALCRHYRLDDRVTFVGRIPFQNMSEEYERADVFIMPSVRETTGAVLLEAMSKCVPIITIDKFGGSILINGDSGWLYDGKTRNEYIEGLQSAIIDCVSHPHEVVRRGKNASDVSRYHVWDNKMHYYQSIYLSLTTE